MNMIFLISNLNKINLIPFTNLNTDFFQSLSYFFRYNFFPILQRKNQMIQQQSFIVTFINVYTHFTKLCFFPKSFLTLH